MPTPLNDSPASDDYLDQGVEDLEEALKKAWEKAESLAKDQAANKRKQEGLKRGVDEIKKNVEEYGTEQSGENLGGELARLGLEIDRKIKCAWDSLGPCADAVKKAIAGVLKELEAKEDGLTELEKPLHGEVEQTAIDKGREWIVKDGLYRDLFMKAMKQRSTDSTALLKKANAIPGTCHENLAETYALLWLARERLTRVIVTTDIDTHVEAKAFEFPADVDQYEERLVEAWKTAAEAAESKLAADESLKLARSTFGATVKELDVQRKAREADIVAAAKEAAPAPQERPVAAAL